MNKNRQFLLSTLVSATVAIILVASLLFFLGQTAQASQSGTDGTVITHTVCLEGYPTCDFATLQDAVDSALAGDVIKVAAGLYTDIHLRAGLTQVAYITKSLTIQGGYTLTNWVTPDANAYPTILDAGDQGGVLVLTGGISPMIRGLTLTGGNTNEGGGLFIANVPNALIEDCDISGNHALYYGGGVFIDDANVTIRDSEISDNLVSEGEAGGIGLDKIDGPAHLELESSIVQGNTAALNAGGIHVWYASATISGTVFFDNRVLTDLYNGGGLRVTSSSAGITNTQFISNTAPDGGGIAVDWDSWLSLSDVEFTNNVATINGGGLYASIEAQVFLNGCTFDGNTAEDQGGGVYVGDDVKATIQGSTFIRNRVENWNGGAILAHGEFITVTNSIIKDNQAPYGGGIEISAGLLQDSRIISNTATYQGGGLRFPCGTTFVTIKDSDILTNTANQGGGFKIWEGYINISSSTIRGNMAVIGGGINGGSDREFCSGDQELELTNSMVVSNTSTDYGGGISLNGWSAAIINSTIAGNRATNNYDGVRFSTPPTRTVEITNTILWDHNGEDLTCLDSCTVNYSDIEQGIYPGTGNISADPLFVDSAHYNFHIKSGSPVIDFGTTLVLSDDFDGDARPQDIGFDIGADEYTFCSEVIGVSHAECTAALDAYTTVDPDTPGTITFTSTQATTTTVDIPAGAVTDTTTLVFTEQINPTGDAPDGFSFAGQTFDLNAYQDGLIVEDFIFQTPITITLHYNETELGAIPEESLLLMYWNEDQNQWEDAACGPYERNLGEDWLRIPICHLSKFALIGEQPYQIFLPAVMK